MATLINGTTLNADITLTKQTGTKVVFDTDQKYVQKDIEINIAVQTATPSFKGGALNNKDATAAFTNMTTSTTNTSGVIIATSGQAGRAAIQYNGAINGWVSASNNGTAMSAISADSWTGETYYATGVTLTNNKTFNITVPDGNSTVTYTISVDNEGNVSGIGEGGGGSAEKKQVNFIDYDGTILHSYTASEANALTALPSNPSHAGLVAQGWNWTLAQIKNRLTACPDGPVWIGQMYITQSGATEIDVTMTAPDLHPYLGIAVNGTVAIDWGDNSTADTVTGTSNTTLIFTGHEYAAAGDYTISISVVSGRFTFCCNSGTNATVLSETAKFNRSNRYSNDITAVRLGENVYIGNNAFTYCTALTSITIPDSVTSIGTYTFKNCYALISITIPDGVTSIGTYVFQNCFTLTSIIIPDGVTSIGSCAFQYCYALTNITIPDGVTDIGNQIFSGCSSLTSITIPDGVISIGSFAFTDCYALASITIPDGMRSIGSSAFSNCYALASITIPASMTSIASSAFKNCYTLTNITIPDGITSIESYVFQNCYSLTSITIPDGIISIGSSAFTNCYSLTSITIPDGMTSIANSAFSNCYALASITIPASMTSIANYAFSNCFGIREMHFKPTTPPTVANRNAFTSAFATDATIYVPTGCLAAYTSATNYPSSRTYTYVEE